MGIVVELAHAKKRVKELEIQIAELRAEYEPELPSGYPTFDIKWTDLTLELEALGVECMLKPGHIPDALVRHTDEESWAKIMPFLVYPADLYVEGVADCDDYARWATADNSKLFRPNGCLECWRNN